MAKKLTEEMVIARTKISDLAKIKRLNCWGSELEDVSLLRRMPSVEVLSLSINKINTLVDFQFCQRLEELYIRQNDIREVNQVVYLQCLPNLKNLWLGENPCANAEGYRLAVIRALPQLQKLDNVQITPEENRDAQRTGKILTHPEDSQDESEEEYMQTTTMPIQRTSSRDQYSETEGSPPLNISPRRRDESRNHTQTSDYEDVEGSEEMYPGEDASEGSRGFSPPRMISPRKQETAKRTYSPEQEYADRRPVAYDRESPPRQQQYYEKSSPTNTSSFEADTTEVANFRDTKLVNSQSASCIKEYSNGNGDKYGYHSANEYCVTHVPPEKPKERYTCPAAHRTHYTRRPVTRNSNILSAVLCLVKELDYPSLEVVEMAVRCRMDEMAE